MSRVLTEVPSASAAVEPAAAAAQPSDPVPGAVLAADARALRLRRAGDALLLPLGRAAEALVRCRAWTPFGYARLDDYARERLDRSGRWVRDMAALGAGVQRMAALAAAVTGSDGGVPIGRVAAVLVSRVADEDSVGAWIALARSTTVRRLREVVAGARRCRSTWPDGAGRSPHDEGAGRAEGSRSPVGTVGQDDSVDPTTPAGSTPVVPDVVDDERTLVRLLVPSPVKAAFDEAMDLHRAVDGDGATVASFVEALVAESYAGPHPPDVDAVPIRRGPDEAVLEDALARSTGRWRHLVPASGSIVDARGEGRVAAADLQAGGGDAPGTGHGDAHVPGAVLDGIDDLLARLDALAGQAGEGGPRRLDRRLRELIALEDRIRRSLGALLADMSERGAWATLMFRGVGHYAEQRLGFGRTAASDRVRLHRSLRRFPHLREAYERGQIGFEAALTIVRLLGPGAAAAGLERSWIRRAGEATVKRLRDEARHLVRVRLLGAGPAGDPVPEDRDFRSPLDDARWHGSLPRDPGRSMARVRALGEAVVPDERGPLRAVGMQAPEAAAAAGSPARGRLPRSADRMPGGVAGGCPDVFLRLRLPADLADTFLGVLESCRQRLTRRVESVAWDRPWPDPASPPSVRAARTFSVRGRRVPSWVALLALLEDYCATWDDPDAMPDRAADRIYRRDGWRCTAPGCSSRQNLEDHHLVYRSRGGGNESWNRTCLCRFHHQRGEHGALASCRGRAPLGIVWRLGRWDLGVGYRNERKLGGDEAGGV